METNFEQIFGQVKRKQPQQPEQQPTKKKGVGLLFFSLSSSYTLPRLSLSLCLNSAVRKADTSLDLLVAPKRYSRGKITVGADGRKYIDGLKVYTAEELGIGKGGGNSALTCFFSFNFLETNQVQILLCVLSIVPAVSNSHLVSVLEYSLL
jgi:hypothetical protein